MTFSRREFLELSAAAGAALGSGAFVSALGREGSVSEASESLRILILGGTGFIGPYQVRSALERGHAVTIFNRGRTEPELFPDAFTRVEKLRGDRDSDLEALEGREWDAVIDNSATIPRWVRQTAQLLKESVGQYLYVSSTGAYYPYLTTNIDEDGPLSTIDDPTTEVVDGETYGGLKVLSEGEVRAAFGDRSLIVRPHYIVGPGDRSDRFTYWPVRIDRGGEVLAPGDPTDPVQYIDVRDLTEWMIHMLEQGTAGTYNAVGPESRLSVSEMVYGIRAVVSNEISFTWVETDFLAEHDVRYMVPWVAPRGDTLGMSTIVAKRAFEGGLGFRPLAVTARDTLDWWRALPAERRESPRAGINPEKEAEVLAAWHEREASDQ